MQYNIKQPSCAYGGVGSLEKIKEILDKEKSKQIMIFTDKGVRSTGLLDHLVRVLEEAQVPFNIIDELKPEPSYQDVTVVLNQVKDFNSDIIIAMGGGSVMDTAKLCSLLIGADYDVKDLLKTPSLGRKGIKTVMIPTTCGTGAEATPNAIVLVPEDSLKVGIVNEEMIPDFVILDPTMIRKLPKAILASTGVDALAHVVECYTSNKATPFSDTYAIAGAKLIFENIREAYSNPENMEAKNNLLLGAYYGGIAITASGTTAVHALSYPLGGKFHIPHGVSNAILFAHVMQFNRDACADRLAKMYDSINPGGDAQNETDKAQYVIDQIADIVDYTDIPTNLAGFGVKKEDMGFLVDAASKVTRLLNNNKKAMTLADIESIYQKVL